MQTVRCVGIFSALGLAQGTADVQASLTAPDALPIASPWSPSHLDRWVFEDIIGTGSLPGSRAEAMRIPAVARARNLVVSTICRQPLEVYRGATRLDDLDQPTWIYSTAGPTHPFIRLAWTIDDLIFYGLSCWSRVNNADGSLQAASRINRDRWALDSAGRVTVDGRPVKANEVILFAGLHEGILDYGRDAISDTRQLYRNVRQRLDNPIPGLELHQTEGADLDDDAIDKLIDRWAAARRGENGGVAYTNRVIELRERGAGQDAALMIEARNAASLDLARVVGVHASTIDATAPKASLNYETTNGRNQELVDIDLPLYMTPITARLSMDDVVPRGSRTAFNVDDFTNTDPSPTGPATQD